MEWISEHMGQHSIGMLLWAGVGLLTAALLILSRTHWGQAKPMSKCIGLSVYAHILFGGYAYVTNFFEAPPLPPQEPIKITYFEQEPAVEETQDEGATERPWDRLSADPTARPIAPEADRLPNKLAIEPTDDYQVDPQPAPELAQASPLDIPPPVVATVEAEFNLPSSESLKVTQSPAAPTPIEVKPTPEVPQRVANDRLRPDAIDMARMETELPQQSDSAPPSPPSAEPLPQDTTAIQRMALVPVEAATADAVLDRVDQLDQSDHRPAADIAASRTQSDTSTSTAGSGLPDLARAAAPVAIPRRLGDGAIVPAPYRNRVEPLKAEALRRHGGDERTEAAVNAALAWLARNQSADGRWSSTIHGGGRESKTLGHDRQGAGSRADTGMTGLAVLAFVGAGHSHLEGEYRDTVRSGVEFLINQQKSNGELAGDALLYARMYCHGIAFLALSETYAVSGDHRLKPYVEKAMQYTIQSQHPATGGWRYQPGDRGDLSQFGWQIMALRSAEHAGLPIPAQTRTRLESFFRSVSGGEKGGLARYRNGERISHTMTAEALACRYFLELDTDLPAIDEASQYLLRAPPSAGKPNLYYWYYGTLGLFPRQDGTWRAWNDRLIDQLISRQQTSGAAAGSWDTDTMWGSYGGRVYTTALSTMCLEVYYRYQPLIRSEADLREIRAAQGPVPWRR